MGIVNNYFTWNTSPMLFDIFKKGNNPGINFGHKTQRSAAKWLIENNGFEDTKAAAKFAIEGQGEKPYIITNPYELKEKYDNQDSEYRKPCVDLDR